MDQQTALVLMDFAENYSFHIQDEAQGYHWTHQCCTVHPVVCYYKSASNDILHLNLCFLSEELLHDAVMVYLIQQKIVVVLKSTIHNLDNVEYFSGGCAAQYKNRKSFYNLCKHKADFEVDAVWSFFATSHGKSPCDGIGGTVKRATAMESLRRPLNGQILNVEEMMSYCVKNLQKMKFINLLKDELDAMKAFLEHRFRLATTVKGTRAFHHFRPLSSTKLGAKRVSQDKQYVLEVELDEDSNQEHVLQTEIIKNKFVCCVYDQNWYIGMVIEIDKPNNDALVEFMHPKGSSEFFHWPQNKDSCWTPFQHILCTIDVPCLFHNRGQYQLTKESALKVIQVWKKYHQR